MTRRTPALSAQKTHALLCDHANAVARHRKCETAVRRWRKYLRDRVHPDISKHNATLSLAHSDLMEAEEDLEKATDALRRSWGTTLGVAA
ncbi:MAG: hypothetical protein AAF517_12850 [Planctomycetota bacterium]